MSLLANTLAPSQGSVQQQDQRVLAHFGDTNLPGVTPGMIDLSPEMVDEDTIAEMLVYYLTEAHNDIKEMEKM